MTSLVGRRHVLSGMAGAAAAAAIAGCSGRGGRATAPTSTSTATATTVAHPPDEARTATYLGGLEALALSAYGYLFDLVNKGKIPAPSVAMSTLITTANAHHRAHLDAWNAVLTKVGHPSVTQPDPGVVAALGSIVQKAISIGVGDAAVSLEQLLASNYVTATPTFVSPDTTRLAASIEVVEWQHVAGALYLLNKPAIPVAFASDALSQ